MFAEPKHTAMKVHLAKKFTNGSVSLQMTECGRIGNQGQIGGLKSRQFAAIYNDNKDRCCMICASRGKDQGRIN